MKILLVEDHNDIAGIICDFFEIKGHSIDYADNGDLGLHLATKNHYDVIILDIMLPKLNGLAVCKNLRDSGVDTPVLMVTALDKKDDVLAGFNLGADDYVVKPFELNILEARAAALHRRNSGEISSKTLVFEDLELVICNNTAKRAGKTIHLNQTQFTILKRLIKRAPDITTREELLDLIWPDEAPDSDILRSHIYQLRNLIDKPFSTSYIKTVPKIGYTLVSDTSHEKTD